MRVWVVDPSNYTPYYDYHLCRALREAGCTVEWLTARFMYEELPFAGDPCVHYQFHRLLRPSYAGRLARDGAAPMRRLVKAVEYPFDIAALVAYAARVRPDVVHFQWLLAPRVEVHVARLIRRLGCRLVYTVHNVQPHDSGRVAAATYRQIGAAMDALIVHSESAKHELDSLLPECAEKIRVIPHGSLFTDQTSLPRAEARRRLSLPEYGRLILFFGLIEPYKGLDDLLRCLPAVVRSLPDVKLVIAGKPGAGFGSAIAQLDASGVTEHTIVRPGFVPSREVAAYFSAADVVALPYQSASQSGVLLTAYTFGRPVVVTRGGGVGETVAADGTGCVVDPGDVNGLAEALAHLLSDRGAAESMGQRARQLSDSRYSWQRIAAQTIAVYRGEGG